MSDADVIASVIHSRRTVGLFKPDPIPLETVRWAIELATWAPNHRKTEPWRFHVIGPQTRSQIVDLAAALMTATKGEAAGQSRRRQWSEIPGWMLVTCQISDDPFLAEEDYAACSCAIQNLLLGLWSREIATKWSTGDITRHPDTFRFLNIDPQKERSVGMIWYGYPATLPEQSRTPAGTITIEHP